MAALSAGQKVTAELLGKGPRLKVVGRAGVGLDSIDVVACRARGVEVKLGGELYSDALGAPGTYEDTLIGMLDHNVTLIARALGGAVPPRGMNGKLKTGS